MGITGIFLIMGTALRVMAKSSRPEASGLEAQGPRQTSESCRSKPLSTRSYTNLHQNLCKL